MYWFGKTILQQLNFSDGSLTSQQLIYTPRCDDCGLAIYVTLIIDICKSITQSTSLVR